MELRQLIYFEAVARTGGFTRAARTLHVAQPALSVQIKQLEKELGARLLARTSRSVSLTDAGAAFLTRCRRILAEVDAARDEMDDLAGIVRGRVTLGATHILGPIHVPSVLAAFHAHAPGLKVTLRAGTTHELLTRLERHEVDLVLAPIDSDLGARFQAQPLASEELVLITPQTHRLASRQRTSMAQLSNEVFVSLAPGDRLRSALDTACAAAGFTPNVEFEASFAGSVRELVSAGLGVSIVTRSTAEAVGGPIAIVSLRPGLPHPPFGIIQLADGDLSAAARTLMANLEASAG